MNRDGRSAELMSIKDFSECLGWSYQKARRLVLKYGRGNFLVDLMGRNYVAMSLFYSWIDTVTKEQAIKMDAELA